MGYDLYGSKPISPEGEHFRRSYWQWPELVEICEQLAPAEMSRCGNWSETPWYRRALNRKDSAALAVKLEHAMTSGLVTSCLSRYSKPSCTEEDFRAFVAFLKTCGGFRIM